MHSGTGEAISPTSTFLHILGANLRDIEARNGKPWRKDASTRAAVLEMIFEEMEKRKPSPSKAAHQALRGKSRD